jgi:HSP20 family protein
MLSLVPLSKLEPLTGLYFGHDWIDRMFDDTTPSLWSGGGGLVPEFDIAETDHHFVVKADLPGIDVKNLDVNVVNNVLTVRGEKKEELEEKKEHYHRVERRSGSFCRSFALPAEVKIDEIDASYRDGVLTLTIPKSETAKQKKIEVKVH